MAKNYEQKTNNKESNAQSGQKKCKNKNCEEKEMSEDIIENEDCVSEEAKEKDCREEEFKESLQRLQAEFANYRKRTDASLVKVKEDGVVYAINKLLPVLDSFKSAKMLVKDEEFLKSLNLIEKQFIEGLSALNITKIEAENQIFDPRLHNAVLTGNDTTKQEDEILEVFQDGYKLDDRVIRHSVVKINKLD